MRYNRKIMHYFTSKKSFIGSLEDSADIGIGEVGALACGDILKIFLKIINNIIVDVKVMVFGCVSAFASSTYMAEILLNKSIYDAMKITNQQIVDELQLPAIKIHCSVLAQEALYKAIENYLYKNNSITFPTIRKLGDGYFVLKKQEQILNNKKTIMNTDSNVSDFNDNIITANDLDLVLTLNALQKFKNYFSNKKNHALFIDVIKEGCGYGYKYKLLNIEKLNSNYCVVDCKVATIIFLKEKYNYIRSTTVDFVEKDLSSYLVFSKSKNAYYCHCGTTFNL